MTTTKTKTMTTITIEEDGGGDELLGEIREAFRKGQTIKTEKGMADFSPYEGLRYFLEEDSDSDSVHYIALADEGQIESISTSAQKAYEALIGRTYKETPEKSKTVLRTSRDAAYAISMMLDHDDVSQPVRAMKITISARTGGYIHLQFKHKDEFLEIVGLALDVAGETLLKLEEWEHAFESTQKEFQDLKALYKKVEDL